MARVLHEPSSIDHGQSVASIEASYKASMDAAAEKHTARHAFARVGL
jgi:hypothetical protein